MHVNFVEDRKDGRIVLYSMRVRTQEDGNRLDYGRVY